MQCYLSVLVPSQLHHAYVEKILGSPCDTYSRSGRASERGYLPTLPEYVRWALIRMQINISDTGSSSVLREVWKPNFLLLWCLNQA